MALVQKYPKNISRHMWMLPNNNEGLVLLKLADTMSISINTRPKWAELVFFSNHNIIYNLLNYNNYNCYNAIQYLSRLSRKRHNDWSAVHVLLSRFDPNCIQIFKKPNLSRFHRNFIEYLKVASRIMSWLMTPYVTNWI